jgi:phospholipase/carboxylesterase
LFRAMVPLQPELQADLNGVGVYMANGRQDPIVPRDNAERLAGLLQGCGADVTLAWSGAGHNLTQGDLDAAQKWLSDISGFGL